MESLGADIKDRAWIKGRFKEEDSSKIIDEEFSIISLPDDDVGFESYKATIDFFNQTLRPYENKRFAAAIKAESFTSDSE